MRHALGLVRQALDDTPLINTPAPAPTFGGGQMTVPGNLGAAAPAANLGQDAIDAFSKARRMNRTWMGIVERAPALQAVRDGIEPDKFVQQVIVGTGKDASVMSVAQLKNSTKASPDAMGAVRGQIVSHLKQRALGGGADEVGNVSQSAYNKALNAIGDRKLRQFFQPDEVNQMKALGRVASYEQFQPVGSAVNNSNTAGAVGAILDRFLNSSLLSKIPFGQQAIGQPLENIMLDIRSGRALDVPPAALLGVGSEEDQRKRSLTP